jgi:hypothetical protein
MKVDVQSMRQYLRVISEDHPCGENADDLEVKYNRGIMRTSDKARGANILK